MKKTHPLFQDQLNHAVTQLMSEFVAWNEVQKELREKGYSHNHYDEKELSREQSVFLAIAERLLLEDIPYENWKWFETPWAGIDGNTGMEARVVDFLVSDSAETASGIIGFYVTRNRRYWYALPLAEVLSMQGTVTCEANCVQDALNALNWMSGQTSLKESESYDDES